MLRVRLTTGLIYILPLPQIDFSLADEDVRKTLQKQLAKVTQTDQDVEAAREHMEGSGKKGVKDTLPDGLTTDSSNAQIEEAFDQEARHSGITVAQQERMDAQAISSVGVDFDDDSYENEVVEDEDEDVEMSDVPVSDVEVKAEDRDEVNGTGEDNKPQEPNETITVTEGVSIATDDLDDNGDAAGDEPQREPSIKQGMTEGNPINEGNGDNVVTKAEQDVDFQSPLTPDSPEI